MRSEDESLGVRAAMRVLALDRTTAVVVERLRSAEIPSLLLKGASFARWLYDHPAERTYVDVDVLVPPSRATDAEEELGRLGFVRSGFETIRDDRPRHALTLLGPGNATVDLHRTLIGVGDGEALFAALIDGCERLTVGGADVDVPAEPGRALVLALHAAKDAGRSAKVRTDLRRAFEVVSEETWRSAADLARHVGAVEAFTAGLRCEPEGEGVADRLGLPRHVGATMALRSTKSPPLAYGLDYVLRAPGVRGKLRFFARKALPPPSFMRAWRPLARRGPLGLAAAYAVRPLWLVWRSVPAVRAVRRARRSSRAPSTEP